jgi:hypothetical protein
MSMYVQGIPAYFTVPLYISVFMSMSVNVFMSLSVITDEFVYLPVRVLTSTSFLRQLPVERKVLQMGMLLKRN